MREEDNRLKIALWVIGGFGVGFATLGFFLPDRTGDLLLNLGTEMGGIVVTVAIIDRLYRKQGEEELKARLIRQMGSLDNADALQAVVELKAHGWLQDGSLVGSTYYDMNLSNSDLRNGDFRRCNFYKGHMHYTDLSETNLEGADFIEVDLRNVNFANANLKGATFLNANLNNARFIDFSDIELRDLMENQMASMFRMCGTIMPDGEKYNGQFRLPGDLFLPTIDGDLKLNDDFWADHYGVTVERYKEGQEWAEENLHKFKQDEKQDQ